MLTSCKNQQQSETNNMHISAKSVALTLLELLAFNAQKFRGSLHLGHAPFSKKFSRGHVWTEPGNMPVKFEMRSFNRLKLVWLTGPLGPLRTHRQTDRQTDRQIDRQTSKENSITVCLRCINKARSYYCSLSCIQQGKNQFISLSVCCEPFFEKTYETRQKPKKSRFLDFEKKT